MLQLMIWPIAWGLTPGAPGRLVLAAEINVTWMQTWELMLTSVTAATTRLCLGDYFEDTILSLSRGSKK